MTDKVTGVRYSGREILKLQMQLTKMVNDYPDLEHFILEFGDDGKARTKYLTKRLTEIPKPDWSDESFGGKPGPIMQQNPMFRVKDLTVAIGDEE